MQDLRNNSQRFGKTHRCGAAITGGKQVRTCRLLSTIAVSIICAVVAGLGVAIFPASITSLAMAADENVTSNPNSNLAASVVAADSMRPATPEGLLASMTLEEKIGQTIWTHVYGDTAATTDVKDQAANQEIYGKEVQTGVAAVEKYALGGILYFNWSHNIGSPADLPKLARLSNDLQAASLRTGKKIPLGITIDQEGGIVARMRYSGTDFAGNMALGATRSEAWAFKQGEILGKELKAVGINVDFAPDVDVNTNPENPVIGVRSISSDPDLVSALGTAQVRGMQAQGVSATVKHFPGHGDTVTDSHLGLPKVTYDRETLEKHLAPFRAAIAAGVDMVMTAHVIVDAIDPTLPGTLSKAVLTDILRGELGFQGVVTTDAIDMEGAWLAVMTDAERQEWAKYKEEAAKPKNEQDPTKMDSYARKNHEMAGRVAVAALQAGSDIILNTKDVPAVFAAVKQAIADGKLPLTRLDDAVLRILKWKEKHGILSSYTPVDPAQIPTIVRTGDSLALARQISDGSITQVCNGNDNRTPVVAIKPEEKILVVGSSWGNPEFLEKLLKDGGFNNTTMLGIADKDPTDKEIAAHVAQAQAADVVIYLGWKANASSKQQEEIAKLQQTGKRMIFVATNTPYDLAHVSCANTALLASYGNQVPNHEGIYDVITGKILPLGKLPVVVPAAGGNGVGYGFGMGYIPINQPYPDKPGTVPPAPVIPAIPVTPDPQQPTPVVPVVPAPEASETQPGSAATSETKPNAAKSVVSGDLPETGAPADILISLALFFCFGGASFIVCRRNLQRY